jgi:hypothetical protein
MFVENMFRFFFQGRREGNEKEVHSETPTYTSSSTGKLKPNGRGIDQHSTWIHDYQDGLSSGKRGDESEC